MDQQIGQELPPIQETGNQQFPNPQNTESVGAAYYTEKQGAQAVEMGQAAVPQAGAAATNPLIPQAAPQQSAPQAQLAAPSALPGMPQIADDTDLIEKAWVLKAKEIVARTRHDPYEQNKQVESFKADYMKKRYNKDIKLTED